jgi:5'-3' exonuclease
MIVLKLTPIWDDLGCSGIPGEGGRGGWQRPNRRQRDIAGIGKAKALPLINTDDTDQELGHPEKPGILTTKDTHSNPSLALSRSGQAMTRRTAKDWKSERRNPNHSWHASRAKIAAGVEEESAPLAPHDRMMSLARIHATETGKE